jgi:hypothetical protein
MLDTGFWMLDKGGGLFIQNPASDIQYLWLEYGDLEPKIPLFLHIDISGSTATVSPLFDQDTSRGLLI